MGENYKTKSFPVKVYQLNQNDIDENIKTLEIKVEIYDGKTKCEYDGFLYGDGWTRHFSFGDWLVFDERNITPSIVDEYDFPEIYEQ